MGSLNTKALHRRRFLAERVGAVLAGGGCDEAVALAGYERALVDLGLTLDQLWDSVRLLRDLRPVGAAARTPAGVAAVQGTLTALRAVGGGGRIHNSALTAADLYAAPGPQGL